MRIWLDPDKLANLGMTATDVVEAISQQNQQVATGALGLPPAPAGQAFTYQLNTLGRLAQVGQFEDIVIRALPNGSVVRMRVCSGGLAERDRSETPRGTRAPRRLAAESKSDQQPSGAPKPSCRR
jgi:Cu/Ag efflux pump CusA